MIYDSNTTFLYNQMSFISRRVCNWILLITDAYNADHGQTERLSALVAKANTIAVRRLKFLSYLLKGISDQRKVRNIPINIPMNITTESNQVTVLTCTCIKRFFKYVKGMFIYILYWNLINAHIAHCAVYNYIVVAKFRQIKYSSTQVHIRIRHLLSNEKEVVMSTEFPYSLLLKFHTC